MPLLAMLLASCAGSGGERSTVYYPESEARARVYWGAVVYFHYDTACVPKENLFGYSGDSMLVSKPGLSSLTNKTIGMSVPADAGRYYHEYLVPAGRPLTISARISTRTLRGAKTYVETSPVGAGTFVPQPGLDYEIFADDGGWRPQVRVRQLSQGAGGVSTTPVAISAASPCP